MADSGAKPDSASSDGSSLTVTIILLVVVGGLFLIGVGNAVLWYWANANMPAKPKKKVGAKKVKRERLRQGLRPAGDD